METLTRPDFERRSYLSSPIERPERKIIQQRSNHPKPSKLPNLSTRKGNPFLLFFFYKIESIFESKRKAEKLYLVVSTIIIAL